MSSKADFSGRQSSNSVTQDQNLKTKCFITILKCNITFTPTNKKLTFPFLTKDLYLFL